MQRSINGNGTVTQLVHGKWMSQSTATSILTALLLFGVLGCQTTEGSRDSEGTIVQLSEWRDVAPHEVDTNIPSLIEFEITKARMRIRDNAASQSSIILDNGRGVISTEWAKTRFSETSIEKVKTEKYFLEQIQKHFKKLLVSHTKPQPVYLRGLANWTLGDGRYLSERKGKVLLLLDRPSPAGSTEFSRRS